MTNDYVRLVRIPRSLPACTRCGGWADYVAAGPAHIWPVGVLRYCVLCASESGILIETTPRLTPDAVTE